MELPTTDIHLCVTCAVEYSPPLPEICPICADERQWVPADGQHWTTPAALAEAGETIDWTEPEPGRFGLTVHPGIGIRQTMQVVCSAGRVVLWDPIAAIDAETVARIRELGEVVGVVASHPHMYGLQVEWGRALGAPVYVNDRDRHWLGREDPVIRGWDETLDLGVVEVHRVGGHFPGSGVAVWPAGAAGAGTLLTGDSIFPNPDRTSVSFMRSYPNRIPLSADCVRRIADRVAGLRFERIVGNFGAEISSRGGSVVEFSARRHIGWVTGEYDGLT